MTRARRRTILHNARFELRLTTAQRDALTNLANAEDKSEAQVVRWLIMQAEAKRKEGAPGPLASAPLSFDANPTKPSIERAR